MPSKSKLILIAVILVIVGTIYSFINPYYQFATQTLGISPLKILLGQDSVKKVGDTVNILILGIAGGTHDGPLLSDSIMVVQYNLATNQMTTLPLPRDVWSPTLQDKINSAYAYGESKQPGGGLILAKAEIGALLDMPIQYGAVISFAKFKTLIDSVGGIDVTVDQSFTDPEFPIEGKENDLCGGDPDYSCRYETLTFTAGKQHMEGTTALKFVRSRHATGTEGSDFARNKRQQLVIAALKSKILALVEQDIKSNSFDKTKELYQVVNSLIVRDITNEELAVIVRNIVRKGSFKQTNLTLNRDVFEEPEPKHYEGKYVLIPVGNDMEAFHSYIRCLFSLAHVCDHQTN